MFRSFKGYWTGRNKAFQGLRPSTECRLGLMVSMVCRLLRVLRVYGFWGSKDFRGFFLGFLGRPESGAQASGFEIQASGFGAAGVVDL